MSLRLSTGLRNQLLGIITNMITNGDFTTVTTGWTAVTATLTSEASGQSGNCLRVAESGGSAAGSAYQDVTTKIGHVYKLSAYFKKGTADAGRIKIGTTGAPTALWDSGALTDAAWALKEFVFIATAVTTRITLESTDATAGEYSEFDTVVLDCVDNGFQGIFKDCFIDVYSGVQPTSADDAPSGTLLCTFYSDGAALGLEFDDAVAGVISKKSTETWSGTAVATGTAGWFRMRQAGDSGASSTTEPRLDGACGTSGAQLNMSSLSIVAAAVQTISTFQITQPAA
jgi:hypothetical protein